VGKTAGGGIAIVSGNQFLYQPPQPRQKEKQMSRREQLIELLVARSSATRERLQRSSTDELEDALSKSLLNGIRKEVLNSPEILARQQEIDEINADRQRMAQENQLSLVFRTPVTVNGKPAIAIDNQGNRNIIAGWLQEDQGESISAAWFQKVLKENPSLARSLSWQSADILDPTKRRQAEAAQAAEERRVFHDFCRDNGFSEVEANLSLIKSVIGSFDHHSLAQAVQSNALQLAPASPEELQQFRQEAISLHNQHLLNLDIPTLRKLVREAGVRGPVAPPPPDETQRVRTATEEYYGTAYPPLPDELLIEGREQLIDASFIKRCSKETLRLLMTRYGSDQINEALRTRISGVNPLW